MSERRSPRNPVAQSRQMRAKKAAVKHLKRGPHTQETLPDAPDNPAFEMFSERKQEEIAQRFQRGIALGELKQAAECAKQKKVTQARRNLAKKRARFAPTLGDALRSRV